MKKEKSFENLISSIIAGICDCNCGNCVSRYESEIKDMIADSAKIMENFNDDNIPKSDKIMMLATIMANATVVDAKGLSTLSAKELDEYNNLIDHANRALVFYTNKAKSLLDAKIKDITKPKDNYDNMSKEELISILREQNK